MDYKKIIKDRNTRQKVLNLLSFIPDKAMVKLQYRIKMGRKLNLKDPQRYTEKLQWYKLYYRNPLMIQCADKYEVRQYVQSKGLGHLLNECYGVYESPEEIDFDALPNQFVLKDTLGGGGNDIIICTDKAALDWSAAKQVMRSWCARKLTRSGGREWMYYSGKRHRILVERYIPSDPNQGGLIDYKFFCFNGKIACLYVIKDREMGNTASVGIYTTKFEKTNYRRTDERPLTGSVSKPNHFAEMLKYAEQLSESFPHVRVDFYDTEHGVQFGELTFFDGSGYMNFEPDEFDFILGQKFQLPEERI